MYEDLAGVKLLIVYAMLFCYGILSFVEHFNAFDMASTKFL